MDDRPAPKRPGLGDGLRRLLDPRVEQREAADVQTALMNHRGVRHVVRVADMSASGAMIVFEGDLAEGDEVVLQLLDHGSVKGQVRWVRDGRVGLNFTGPAESTTDQ